MTSNSKLHPDNATLESYSLQRLADRELERVEEHLFVCERCQEELTAIDSYVRELKDALAAARLRPEPEPARFWKGLFAIPRPVMAGAFAAFLLVFVLPLARHQPMNDTPSVVELETYRGAALAGTFQALAMRPLVLRFAGSGDSECSLCSIEIVRANGSPVWKGTPSRDREGLVASTKAGFQSGRYWVRLFDPAKVQIGEFALELK